MSDEEELQIDVRTGGYALPQGVFSGVFEQGPVLSTSKIDGVWHLFVEFPNGKKVILATDSEEN